MNVDDGQTRRRRRGLFSVKDPQRLRLILAILLICGGMTLLFMGFWVSPRGEIHSSVLIAYGEIMTFVGALIGIDYAARERLNR